MAGPEKSRNSIAREQAKKERKQTLQLSEDAKNIARAIKKAEKAKKDRKDDLIVILMILVIIAASVGFAFFAKEFLRGTEENVTDVEGEDVVA